MGLKINKSIETNKGTFDSVYLRIEFIRIEKYTGKLYCSPTLYPNEEIAKNSTVWDHEKTLDRSLKYDGVSIELPDIEVFPMTSEEVTEDGIKNRIDTSVGGSNIYSWVYLKMKESYQKIFGNEFIIDC